MSGLALAGVEVPGDAEAWQRLGFAPVGTAVALGNGAVVTGAAGVAVVVDGADVGADLEGVAVRSGAAMAPTVHPNSAVELDHLVLMTDSLERTSAAVADQWGLEQRRVREAGAVRQAFHRFADARSARGCIVEIVERADVDRTSLWGLVVNVRDLDVAVAAADGLVGTPKDAVQPGRRIATVRREAGLPLAVALMSAG